MTGDKNCQLCNVQNFIVFKNFLTMNSNKCTHITQLEYLLIIIHFCNFINKLQFGSGCIGKKIKTLQQQKI